MTVPAASVAPVATTFTGRLQIAMEMRGGGSSVARYVLTQADGTRLDLHPRYTDNVNLSALNRSQVSVTGTRNGNDVAVKSARGLGAKSASAAAANRNVRVAVLMLNFADDRSNPWTKDQVYSSVFTEPKSAAKYWGASSNNAISVSGDVFGWYPIAARRGSGCDWYLWTDQARAAATAARVDLSKYTNIQLWYPMGATSCLGLGELGGALSWVGDRIFYVTTHELGHNLDLAHSNGLVCHDAAGSVVTLSDSCDPIEYADPFDIMGGNYDGPLATDIHKVRLGVLSPTVATTGTYTLSVGERVQPGTVQSLQLNRPDGTTMFLAYRRPFGEYGNLTAPASTGVTIHLEKPDVANYRQAYIIDTTPQTPWAPGVPGFDDAPLQVGKSFVDPLTKQAITVTAMTSTTATVTIAAPQVTVSSVGGTLNVVAGTGIPDVLTVTRSLASGVYTVSDSANVIAAGVGCITLTKNQVRCASAPSVVVKGGNRADTITVEADTAKVKIDGGSGNDVLINSGSGPATINGKGGNDTIRGGSGIDALKGGPGNDTIYSADRNAEKIECSTGSDTVFSDWLDVGFDCETVTRS